MNTGGKAKIINEQTEMDEIKGEGGLKVKKQQVATPHYAYYKLLRPENQSAHSLICSVQMHIH